MIGNITINTVVNDHFLNVDKINIPEFYRIMNTTNVYLSDDLWISVFEGLLQDDVFL